MYVIILPNIVHPRLAQLTLPFFDQLCQWCYYMKANNDVCSPTKGLVLLLPLFLLLQQIIPAATQTSVLL